jgi:HEAT repeat protein
MATSLRQFNVEIYREHLEEASFLYEQRLAYLTDPEVNWPDLEDPEDRLDAQIDGLVVGGGLALQVCRQAAALGDVGVQHAAVRVFCRQGRRDDAFALLNTLDPADEEAVRAVSHALRSDLPTGWRDGLLGALQGGQPVFRAVAAHVIGYRRFAHERALIDALSAGPRFGSAELAWALGRVGSPSAIPALVPLIDDEDAGTCEAAAIALLRLGDVSVIDRALRAAPRHAWAQRVLGVGGDARSVPALLELLRGPLASADAVLALGLLGDLAALEVLLQLLDHDALSAQAAVALNTMTGAGLYGLSFVPAEFDPDELSDEERESFERDGALPTRGGQPYGTWQRGPLRDRAGWRAWLEANQHRFERGLCWRMGRPYGPAALLECLRSETSPYAVRRASYEELVVRYGLDVPFEADLPVRTQRRFLDRLGEWVRERSPRFAVGRWYVGGQLG